MIIFLLHRREVASQRVGLRRAQTTTHLLVSNHIFSAHWEVRAPEGSHGTSVCRACVPWQGSFSQPPIPSYLILFRSLLPISRDYIGPTV